MCMELSVKSHADIKEKEKKMKKYSISGWLDDTWGKPMTANELRHRFWCLEDNRTIHYKDFTIKWIEMCWNVKFIKR